MNLETLAWIAVCWIVMVAVVIVGYQCIKKSDE